MVENKVLWESFLLILSFFICDALRGLVSLVQLRKRDKHRIRSVILRKNVVWRREGVFS